MEEAGRLCWELAKASVWGQTSLMRKDSLIFRAVHFKANDPVVSLQENLEERGGGTSPRPLPLPKMLPLLPNSRDRLLFVCLLLA